MTPRCTLVVAVYNKDRDLQFVLAALERQSFREFEVIVADDGSGNEVADVVNTAKRNYSYPIRHLWHADKGWRKNAMLNYAVHESATDYIIFIDGDCIPSRKFIEDHWNEREYGKILLGRRVEHGPRWARTLTLEKIESGSFERYTPIDLFDAVAGRSQRLEHGIRIPVRFLRLLTEKNDSILGCNFSTFKEYLVEVNGFDEDYDGPGSGEDSDIFYRMGLIGTTGMSLRNLAIQYHIWHTPTTTSQKNYRRFLETQARGKPQCRNGMKKH